jgi:hypothetical protein
MKAYPGDMEAHNRAVKAQIEPWMLILPSWRVILEQQKLILEPYRLTLQTWIVAPGTMEAV